MATHGFPDETSSEDAIRFHHGTDLNSAQDLLLRGLNSVSAATLNVTGEFWATTNPNEADTFAQANPAGGVPARFSFDLSVSVVQRLLSAKPPRVYQHGPNWYEFLPASYPELNRRMTNRQAVSPVP